MLVAGFADGVDLDGEGDGNATAVQFAGEFGGLGGPRTAAVDDDGGRLFCERGEDAVVVGVEEADELMEGFSAVVIAKDFNVGGRVAVVKVCGELDFRVFRVAGADEASNETDDDGIVDWRGC